MAFDLNKIGRFIDLVEKHLAGGDPGDSDALSARVAKLENQNSGLDAAVADFAELKTRVATLEAENADLKSKISDLEAFEDTISNAIDPPVTETSPTPPVVTPTPVEPSSESAQ